MTRPPLWIGHVDLHSNDLDATEQFLIDIGMRPIFSGDDVRVLELRGGTHIVVLPSKHTKEMTASFDLMIEDIDVTYKNFQSLGFTVSELARGTIHDSFYVTEPGGNKIQVNSTHIPDHSAV